MAGAWGGHSNGRIPLSALRQLEHATGPTGKPVTHLRLRRDASLALDRLLLKAAEDGYQRWVTDAYRTYATQVTLKRLKGRYAATPGTSEHGWALAGDLAYSAGPKSFGRWMWANEALAREHGWYPPAWTHDGRGIEEPWHWEYDPTLDRHRGEPPEEDQMKTEDFEKIRRIVRQEVDGAYKPLSERLAKVEAHVKDTTAEAKAVRAILQPAKGEPIGDELDLLRRDARPKHRLLVAIAEKLGITVAASDRNPIA